MSPFRQITIVGVGLLGGSLAKICKQRGLADKIVGFGRSAAKLEQAKRLGIIDTGLTDLRASVAEADLVVLCSPVGMIVPLAREMAAHLQPGCIVTDVGSVKKSLVAAIEPLLPGSIHFVGSHPIAGGEKSGFETATADLFQGAKCIVTPTPKTDAAALAKIKELWEQTGMEVVELDVEEHDFIFGAVSHLPHVIAFVLMNTVGGIATKNYAEITSFSGGGLKDITRIASSNPVMWRDIFLSNKVPMLDLIDKFEKSLREVRSMIEKEDGGSLERTLETANKHRLNLI